MTTANEKPQARRWCECERVKMFDHEVSVDWSGTRHARERCDALPDAAPTPGYQEGWEAGREAAAREALVYFGTDAEDRIRALPPPESAVCCASSHVPRDTACRGFLAGANGRCVYCDHEGKCHPGPGATCELGSGEAPLPEIALPKAALHMPQCQCADCRKGAWNAALPTQPAAPEKEQLFKEGQEAARAEIEAAVIELEAPRNGPQYGEIHQVLKAARHGLLREFLDSQDGDIDRILREKGVVPTEPDDSRNRTVTATPGVTLKDAKEGVAPDEPFDEALNMWAQCAVDQLVREKFTGDLSDQPWGLFVDLVLEARRTGRREGARNPALAFDTSPLLDVCPQCGLKDDHVHNHPAAPAPVETRPTEKQLTEEE